MTESTSPAFTMPELPMDILTIREYLPHRYPFILVDRVTEVTENSIVGYKNVSINEEFLQGHFPTYPIMPGVLIIEALAQATGILAFKSEVGRPVNGQIYMLVGVDKVRFKRLVEPGDQLQLKVEVVTVKRGIWKFNCKATVEGQLVTSAEIICTQKAAK